MLCVISKNTLTSKWVPFEVGYGFDKTDLATVILKGVSNTELPDYIKTAPVIRDIYDITSFCKQIRKQIIYLKQKCFLIIKMKVTPLNDVNG